MLENRIFLTLKFLNRELISEKKLTIKHLLMFYDCQFSNLI